MAARDALKVIGHSVASLMARAHVASIFTNDPAYLEKKFEEHRTFTSVLLVLFSCSNTLAWFIDNSIDSTAARNTFLVRIAGLWMLIPAFIIRRTQHFQRAAAMIVACCAIDIVCSLAIFKFLNNSLALGVGGFLIYPLGAVLLCLGLPLRVSLSCILMSSSMPPILALCGWLTDFPYALYTAFMGPSTGLIFILSSAFSWSYHRRFLLERSLEEASNTDPLTGVANRRHFQKLLQRELAQSTRFDQTCALLMLDIDHFKRVNDTFGHPTGDRVICSLAEVCTDLSRYGDYVARLGGEEFAVLLPNTTAEQAANLAERIRVKVEDQTVLSEGGAEVRWTVSVGATGVRPGPDVSISEVCEYLISRADAALYDAKKTGRNRVVTLVG